MIEICKDEIRLDETVLKYATDEEVTTLRAIAQSIVKRIKRGHANE